MKDIKTVLEKTYSTPSLRRTIVPLFIGNPGLGKTVLIEEFAREKGVQIVELITSQMSPFEISGICIPSHTKERMVYYDFDRLADLKDGDILFFDELLNGNPVVLNACLTILEQRRFISGKPLPDIMIVAAANPQGMVPITPQIKERFVWYNVEFNLAMWKDYMKNKYKMPSSIVNKLGKHIKDELFKENNFFTPRSIDKAVNMYLHSVPSPYNESIGVALNELVKNPFNETIGLPNGLNLFPDEMVPWAELAKLKTQTYETT